MLFIKTQKFIFIPRSHDISVTVENLYMRSAESHTQTKSSTETYRENPVLLGAVKQKGSTEKSANKTSSIFTAR